MSKRVLVISTTLRKDGNSELLSKEFARGAKDNGNEVEFISLRGKNIEFCRGCLNCQITETCIINDDVKEIISKMKISDVITFSTPIYYYEMSGQLKTLLDRANPLFQSKYNFKDIYWTLDKTDAGKIVNSPEELKNYMDKLLSDKEFYTKACEDCKKVFEAQSGALDFVIDKINKLS